MQLLSSLGYAAAAAGSVGKDAITAAALFENFAAGLGTAAFLAFLMSVCERRYAATQFALLTAVYALSRWAAGLSSGVLAERLGFASYFLLTFLAGAAGIPAVATHAHGVDRPLTPPASAEAARHRRGGQDHQDHENRLDVADARDPAPRPRAPASRPGARPRASG